jgi:hypothetical protein
MDKLRRAPIALLIAAATLLIEELGLLFFYSINPESFAIAALGVILAVLLVGRSRVAYALVAALALTGLVGPFVWNEPTWVIATSAVILLGLLRPASRSYFWRRGSSANNQDIGLVQRWYDEFDSWSLRVSAGLSVEREGPLVNQQFLIRFAIGFGVLFVVVGGIRELHLGAGHDSEIVDVLWSIAWPLYTLVKVAFLILLAIAGYSYAKDRWDSWQAARD